MITLTPYQLEQSKFEEVALQFWSEDENTRSNLLKNHYHDVKFLHSLPVLIEFKKESLLDNYGAPSNTLITYGAILERNLYCINFLLRRAQSWRGAEIYYFKSSEVKGSPEVMATLENEDSSSGWLISCIKSVVTGSDIKIRKVIDEYLKDTSPPTPQTKRQLWNLFRDAFPCWSTYNIPGDQWISIMRSEKRDDILAALASLNRCTMWFDSNGLKDSPPFHKGFLDTHLLAANSLSHDASLPAFGNCVIWDAIGRTNYLSGIVQHFYEEVNLNNTKGGGHEILCQDFWRLDGYKLNNFILRVPQVDRPQIRRFIATAGFTCSIMLSVDEWFWPKALKKTEVGHALRLDPMLFYWFLDGDRSEEGWNYLIQEGTIAGTWGDLNANSELLMALDYSIADKDSPFFTSGGGLGTWPKESWLARIQKRSLANFS